MRSAADRARSELAERLNARREEIEEALLARVYGIEEPVDVDVEYLHGLRETVAAALDYALAALQLGEDRTPPVPMALLVQARLAARNGVSLDVVIRRYFSGFMLLADLLLEEAEGRASLRGRAVHRLLTSHSAQVDRLVDLVAEEYKREALPTRSTRQRRDERVQRVLDGESLDLGEFGYELGGWHIALVLEYDRQGLLRQLAEHLDGCLLWVCPRETVTWAWFGGGRRIESSEVAERVELLADAGDRIAIGEPARGLTGWRLTHKQAKAAFPVIDREKAGVARYLDVGLIACVLEDEVLATSLRQRYIAPLSDERDGGQALRDTLKAYFAAGRSISSAAAALRLNRQTVRNRLRKIEEKLDRPLDNCAVEVEIALRLEQHRPSCGRVRAISVPDAAGWALR